VRRRIRPALLGLGLLSVIPNSLPAPAYRQPAANTKPHRSSVTAPSLQTAKLHPRFTSIAKIIASHVHATMAYRLRTHEPIIVLEFASLHTQALMLNRVAVVVEKDGGPRDRILNETELNHFIRATGADYDTFYDGHDY
jgi:hypothetical protein